jgi:hypothetical protein
MLPKNHINIIATDVLSYNVPSASLPMVGLIFSVAQTIRQTSG